MKIQKLIVILIVCLLSVPFTTAFPAFADEISSTTIGEQPSNPHDPPVISEEPKPSEGQLWDENDSSVNEKDDSFLEEKNNSPIGSTLALELA